MKRYLITIPGCLAIMILIIACASPRPIPLPADFWIRENLSIGVAMGKASEPKVHTVPSLFGHPLPYSDMLAGGYGGFYESGEFGDQGDMQITDGKPGEQPGRRQYGKSPLAPSVAAGTLKENFHAMGTALLLAVQKLFVQRLAHTGWQVVPVQGPIGDDYRHIEGLRAYDALIIIDCDWYGVHCRTKTDSRTPTLVQADMHAWMIDLKSGTLLWQSPRKKAGNPVSCTCSDPDCFPHILSALQKAIDRAGNALLADLFLNRP